MNTLKKISAFVLAFMLIFSMCMVSVSAAEASTATVLYVKPGSNWVQSDSRYAMYLFNSTGNTWVDMTDEDGDGYYEAEVPAGDWTNVIFCRMNPKKKENNWNNKWNQTSDLAIPTDFNCYLVKDGTWDEGGGEWVAFVPGEEPSTAATEPTEAPSYKYTVAGDAGLCGVAWTPASEENALTDEDGDGIYEITYKNVPAGSYSFKVTDGTWNNSWGVGTGNYSINLNVTADVTIRFTESTKKIEAVSEGLGDFVLKNMTVVGDEGLVGVKWDPKSKKGVMTQDADGIWNITFKNIAAGEYGYKFIANDNYTYNWTVEGNFDSADNSIVKVDSDGSDVTLTIDVSSFDFATKKGSVKATATVTVGTPTEPSESTDPTEPTAAPSQNDYYLFGTINGANYGCEEDWETIGDYKFVDGKLSATFETVSYVAVKTGDNAGWYMTDGWAGTTKSATLYNTSKLGEDANKLIVPAGKVDFTLVENADGSLTLSYESENEPEIPTEPATEPSDSTDPTEPTAAPSQNDYYLFGTINGANYGCEEDWETIGDYKFVDGKLSTTFDTVSYVAVKTGDNKSWYMTDGWAGITKSVTLYTTDKLGEDANKLIVPAGKVDFTLVENEDGTLTLSYESENEPEIPTEPATEPTQPQSKVSVTGDIALPLADDGNGIYTGSTELEAGSYAFKMSVNGVAFGNGSTFTDKTTNATYNSKWTSSTTLKATGGKYTFKFNTAKNTLTIEYLAPSKASIVGDINLDLQATKDANVYSASVKLNKGNYEFRVMNQGVRYCCGYTYKDFTVGSQFNSKWSSASTLAASGGTYTFSYDIDTNKLTISYLPAGAEVSVVGNFTLALAKTDKENVYSGTKTLKAGNYQIKINNYGKLCGTSAVVKDVTPGLVFNPKWSKYTTFVATGGTYTFTYNTATNTLVVTADKGDIPVKVTGDINLTLNKSDTNVFTGSVNLKKGDYSFKMNVNGVDFCNGTTIKNATTGIKYISKYTSASTLAAVGGTYTFTYNAVTNLLVVGYSK